MERFRFQCFIEAVYLVFGPQAFLKISVWPFAESQCLKQVRQRLGLLLNSVKFPAVDFIAGERCYRELQRFSSPLDLAPHGLITKSLRFVGCFAEIFNGLIVDANDQIACLKACGFGWRFFRHIHDKDAFGTFG